jgi:hypothetical protein
MRPPRRSLQRVLAMDSTELRVRGLDAIRREAGRFTYACRRPSWQRATLARRLRDDKPILSEVARLVTSGDWRAAHARLLDHFVSRQHRFVLNPSGRDAFAGTIRSRFPGALADARQRADRICQGRFDLLGYRDLSFASDGDCLESAGLKGLPPPTPDTGRDSRAIDWHFDPVHKRRAPSVHWSRVPYLDRAIGDHKVIWELNRHQQWLALGRAYWLSGDGRYRAAFVRQLESWMAANPPLTGINWASMLELGLRSISWIWALHLFVAPEPDTKLLDATGDEVPWTIDLLLGVDRQLSLVERHLSRYSSPNTHLLGESLGLYVAGRALPELRRARRWEQVGLAVLLEQTRAQINADGGHAELSPHYHRYALDFYLLALAVARATSDEAARPLAEVVLSLAAFARVIADDAGRLPRIGDDDGGMLFPMCGRNSANVSDSLAVAAHLLGRPDLAIGPPTEEVVWMAGDVSGFARALRAARSTACLASGYFISRAPRGDHMVVEAGRHGFLNGGHAHADALSLTLTVAGRPFFIDPGTGCYTADPAVRDRFRSSRFHNTLTLDGRSQSEPDGPFHWRSSARGALHAWSSTDVGDYFDGSHDGYHPLVHRRTIVARPGCWIIVDRILGDGRHRADLHWHIDPSWAVSSAGVSRVRADHPSGARVWVLSGDDAVEVARGSERGDELGWCVPAYGPLVPTAALRRTRTAHAPYSLITVIVEAEEEPALEVLPADDGTGPSTLAVGVRLTTSQYTDTALFAAPGVGGLRERRLTIGAGLETDGTLLCQRVSWDGRLMQQVLVDGRFARVVPSELDEAESSTG